MTGMLRNHQRHLAGSFCEMIPLLLLIFFRHHLYLANKSTPWKL